MVMVWIGVAIGVLITVILIIKLLKTPSHVAISLDNRCKTCGTKITDSTCPRCSKKYSFGV